MVYNADFQIIINKFSNSDKNLFINLRLVAYFYRIEATYSDFATAQRSLARTKIPKLPIVIVKLEDKRRQARTVESIIFHILSKESIKRKQSQRLIQGGHVKNSSSTLNLKVSKDKYAYCDTIDHSKDNC